MSTENVCLGAADSWDDVNADPVGKIVEKMEKVKLLQRKEQKKEEFFEKVKSEDNGVAVPKLQSQEGSEAAVEEPKRVFLRRPKDGFTSETVGDSSPESAQSTESSSGIRSRNPDKIETKKPTKTFEQRQADYQAARDRIMGSEYKPDNQEIKEIKFIDRSKSPETLRMTQQNMQAHYGEELGRELMEHPEETADRKQVPDFTFQQPPPNMMMAHDGEFYSAPPGFSHGQQQPFQPQNMEFYRQSMNNGQIPMHFVNQQGFQQLQHQFMPQEAAVNSSSSQNSLADRKNEQNMYYFQQSQVPHNQRPPQQQMFQNYVPYNLPDMSYPPPNMIPNQSSQQPMGKQLNQAQMAQMAQMQHQQVQNGAGRGQNRGPFPVYPMVPNGAISQPPPLMSQSNQYRGAPPNSSQNRNANGGQSRQNGQFQNHQNGNGRRNNNRTNGANHQALPANFSLPPPGQQGGNIIPFGCPPRHVNAFREQYGMAPNSGAGLLGAHPSIQQWSGPPQ